MAKTEYQQSCSTSAKRKALAAELLALGNELNLETSLDILPREIVVMFAKGDYRLSVDLDGDLPIDCFLGHWYTRGAARYPQDFAATIRGTLNTYHYGKATTHAETFERLAQSIRAGFNALAHLVAA
jgi:hypothetical protein